MKFAAFAFFASFCLVAVTAKGIGHGATQYGGFFQKTIKCGYKEILNTKNVTLEVLTKATTCAVDLEDEVTHELIDSLHDVVGIVDDTIEIYKNDCEGGKYSWYECLIEIVEEVAVCGKKLVDIGGLILKARDNGDTCVWGAVKDLSSFYLQFPQRVRDCRKTFF